MFDTVFGLPVHALVMHAVVVLVPLSALGVIAMAAVPRWRQRFGAVVLGVATAGLAAVPVATRSGGELEARLGASGIVAEQIDEHQEMGELVIWPTLAMWVLAVAMVLMDRQARGRQRRRSRAMQVVAVLAALAAVAAAAQVAVAGHLGSTAVWSCVVGSDACS